MSAITTVAPSAASRNAIALPMPWAPPITMVTFPPNRLGDDARFVDPIRGRFSRYFPVLSDETICCSSFICEAGALRLAIVHPAYHSRYSILVMNHHCFEL